MLYGLCARWVIARFGPKRMIAAGALLVSLCYALIATRLPWPAVAALFAVSGFGFYVLHNTMQAASTELAPLARGAAVALLASCFFTGQGLGPILSGVIAVSSGYGTMFVVSAAAMAILGIVSSRLLKQR